MTNLIFGFAIAATTLAACNNGSNKAAGNEITKRDTVMVTRQAGVPTTPAVAEAKIPSSIKEIVTAYLQLKNAFTKDNSDYASFSIQ